MLSAKGSVGANLSTDAPTLELHEIQATVLRPRPAPYFGTHVLLRVDDAQAGRAFLRRLTPYVGFRRELVDRSQCLAGRRDQLYGPRSARAFPGLAAELSRGVPRRDGGARKAARRRRINDPKNWDKPFGTGQVHIGVSAFSDSEEKRRRALAIAREQYEGFSGVSVLAMQDFGASRATSIRWVTRMASISRRSKAAASSRCRARDG